MSNDGIDLAAIEARAGAATPGPWSAADEHGLMEGATPAWCVSRDMTTGKWMSDICYVESGVTFEEPDAEFIAAARADVPALVAEVERLREIVNAQKAATSEIRTLIRRARSAEHRAAWLQRRLGRSVSGLGDSGLADESQPQSPLPSVDKPLNLEAFPVGVVGQDTTK